MKDSEKLKLVNCYSKIFIDPDALMLDNSSGWYNILDCMCNAIQGYIDHQNKISKDCFFVLSPATV